MKPALFLATIGFFALFSVGCTSNDRFQVGGVPKFIMGGAKLSSEPAPMKPDAAHIPYERESGPFAFSYITDSRDYPTPPRKKVSRTTSIDTLEHGRQYRIKRLFR